MATPALPPEDMSLDAASTPEPEEIETEDGRLLLPFSFAKRHGLLVHGYEDGQALTLVRNDADPTSLSETRRFIDCPLRTEIVTPEVFDARITEFYERESQSKITMVDGLADDDLFRAAQDLPEPSDLLESDDDAPIIRLINAVLTSAVKDNASDIHIEPFENRLVVRFRIDGVLREVLQSRRAVATLIVSRIKVMSKLDIAEKRLPQDGRISLRIAGRAVDVRVSTMPSGHGERVVLRLLDKHAGRLDLAQLGMSEAAQKDIDAMIHRPHGIILVTGPTGSGKTTTLYAALERINDDSRNIMTV
jgi:general secretion pathway protein E